MKLLEHRDHIPVIPASQASTEEVLSTDVLEGGDRRREGGRKKRRGRGREGRRVGRRKEEESREAGWARDFRERWGHSSESSSGERSQRFRSRNEGPKTERSPWEDRGKAMTRQEATAELRT